MGGIAVFETFRHQGEHLKAFRPFLRQHRQDDLGGGIGVGSRLMVVQVDTQMRGNRPEVVRRQVGPHGAGNRQRAEIVAGKGNVVVPEQRPHHPHVEPRVVRGEQRVLEIWTEFRKHGIERRCASNMLVRDAVNADEILPEPAEPFRRFDQTLHAARDFARFDHREAEGAGADAALIGGLEINDGYFHACDSFSHAACQGQECGRQWENSGRLWVEIDRCGQNMKGGDRDANRLKWNQADSGRVESARCLRAVLRETPSATAVWLRLQPCLS